MSQSSEEQANVTEIELKRWESEYYTRLEKEFFKLQSGAESNFTCPYCPGPSGHDCTLNELLLHASIVYRGCSLTGSEYRNKAKHLALERYITTKYLDDDQLFVWPWMGILYITSASGETTVSQVKQELARKGFYPVRVQTFPNPEAQSVFAVVGFEASWDGFLCAMSFEKSFDVERKLTCNDLGEQWHGWVARHADYNSRSTLGDYLRSHGGLTNVSDQRPPLNLQEMERDCLEIIASLQKLKIELNGKAKAYDDEIQKMQQTMIELIEKMFLVNGKGTFLLDSHKEELEKELERSEYRKKYLEKKLAQCIHGKMHCEETLAQIKSPKKHQLQGKLEPMDPLRIKVQKKFEAIETQEKELQKSLRKIDPHMSELQIKLRQIKYAINEFHKNFELIESDKRKLQQKFEHSDELQRKLAHCEAQNQDLREKLEQIEPQKKEYQIMLELNKELQEKLEQTERQKNELLAQNEASKKELEEKLSKSETAKKELHIRFCMASRKSERATLEHKKTLRFAKEKKILQRLNNKLHQKIIELESKLAKKEDELAYKDDLNQTLVVKERKRTDGLHDEPRIELVSMATDCSFPQADESKAYLDGPIKFPAASTDGVTEVDIMERFASSVSIVTSLASAISYPTLEATSYTFLSAYKNVLAIAVVTDYSFPQADKFKAYLEEPIKFVAAATDGVSSALVAKEEEKDEPVEDWMTKWILV